MSHDHKNSSGTKQTTPEEDNKEDRLSVHSNASQEHADDTNEKARESPVQADDTANQDASSHHSPEPNEQNHQDDDPDDDDADLQNYKQDEDPENFDSKSFLSSVSDLSEMLQADNLRHVDNDFPAKEIKSMVRRVSSTMDTFKNYAVYSQGKLEVVRDQMKEIRDRVHKRIQTKGYDPRSAHERKSYEERELDAKLAKLNREIAKAAEELSRASQVSIDTEAAAIEAALVAEQAAEEAKRIQEDYETRRQAEVESRKAEERRREEERRRREEETKRQDEVRQAEEAMTARLKKPEEQKLADWENWTGHTYNIPAGDSDFHQGLGCVIRGDPSSFRENSVSVKYVIETEVTSPLAENEEQVSDVISLESSQEEENTLRGVYVAIPHCMSRASAMTREPVIKAEVDDGKWMELKGQEVTLEKYKDLKFVQAEVKQCSKLCVVARYKRDFLHFSKKGGKAQSNVDARVTFIAEKGTFKKPENFVLQLHPVDSGTVSRMKEKSPESSKLLTSSSIVHMEWGSQSFDKPITMTLPCPPNPVKAKKAAAARAAKEAKMKNPQAPMMPKFALEEPKKKKPPPSKGRAAAAAQTADDEERPSTAAVTRWYMGQYGNNEDDENDLLFFVRKMSNGRWQVLEQMVVIQAKLDLLQLRLTEPFPCFMVVRTRTSADTRVAQCLAEAIEECLRERVVGVMVRQMADNPEDVILTVTPTGRMDKTIKALEDAGYETGDPNNNTPAGGNLPAKDAVMRTLAEGDDIEVTFRGNIQKSQKDDLSLEFTFNSQMVSQKKFSINEVNKYLQRSFSEYRGYIQLVKKTKVVNIPTKKEESEGRTQPWTEVTTTVISEHAVRLPKDEYTTPRTLVKAPVLIKNEDHCLDQEALRHIAQSLGDEWYRLANFLNVKRQRIQAILRNNVNNEEEEAKLDMLLTWLKKVPRSQDKVEYLKNGLVYCSRADLAQELRHMDEEFQQTRRTGSATSGQRERPRTADRTSIRSQGSVRSVRDA